MPKKIKNRWKFTTKDFQFKPMTLLVTFETKAEARAWVKENARRRAAGLVNAGLFSLSDIGPFTLRLASGKVEKSYCVHP